MRTRPRWFYTQSAVVPYRERVGAIEVLLITSRSGKRWTIPKGIVELGMTDWASAAKEAYEEAGVRGDVGTISLGTYTYEKWGDVCTVAVYPLHVVEELAAWPEANSRQRRWVTLDEALSMLEPKELCALVEALRSEPPAP